MPIREGSEVSGMVSEGLGGLATRGETRAFLWPEGEKHGGAGRGKKHSSEDRVNFYFEKQIQITDCEKGGL